MEQWKDIPGYEGLYKISNKGKIKNVCFINRWGKIKRELILKPNKNNKGYLTIELYKNRNHRHFLISRLVAGSFLDLDLYNTRIVVCHKDDNPLNNNIENLFLGTQKDNMKDCKNKKRNTFGQKNGRAKLTLSEVIKIRNEYTGKRGEQIKLSKKYNISPMSISLILRNIQWVEQT